MNVLPSLGLVWLAPALLSVPVDSVPPARFSTPLLDRQSYSSPSGAFVLTVDASKRSGAGPGTYRLEHGGTLLWEREHPFTFRDAAVTDRGVSAGYSHASTRDDPGETTFAVLGPDGFVRGKQRGSKVTVGTGGNPLAGRATCLAVLEDADTAFLAVTDFEGTGADEDWWRLRLSTGEVLDPIRNPKALLAASDYAESTTDVRGIPGTPLILSHWYGYELHRDSWLLEMGAVFSLHEPDGRLIWELALEGDYAFEFEPEGDERLRIMRTKGSILGTRSKSFDLWHAQAGERVTYDIRLKGDSWEVVRVGSAPYDAQLEAPAETRFDFRAVDAGFLGWTEFPTAENSARPARDTRAWGVDGSNHIGAIKRPAQGQPFPFVLHDKDGREVSRFDLTFLQPGSRAGLHLLWLGGDRWLTSVFRYVRGEAGLVELYGVDAKTGVQEQLATWQGGRPKAMARRPDGGFVLLESRNTVTAFDAELAKAWTLGPDDSRKDAALRQPDDVAVLRNGCVVVLDRKKLKVFDSKGTFLTIVQPRDVGFLARRLSRLYALPDGGLLAFDHKRDRTLHRINSNFRYVESVRLHYADSSVSNHLELQTIGPDGTWWGRDASSFIGFSPRGRARHFAGRAPDPRLINEVEQEGAVVDSRGNIYFLDKHTAVLHSLRIDGSTRWATRLPAPAGFQLEHIAVDDEGVVYLRKFSTSRCIRIDARGQVLGRTRLGRRSPRWRVFIPGSKEEWVWRNATLQRVDQEGRVLASATKDPGGRWLQVASELHAASDGSVAFIDKDETLRRPDRLIVLDRSTAAKAIVDLPSDISTTDIAYDGQTVVLRTNDGLAFLSLDGSPHRLASLPGEFGGTPFLSPDGKEVWIHSDGEPRIARFAVP